MGNENQSTIEINGKQYDARTGKLLPGLKQLAHVSKAKPASRSMDVAGGRPLHKPLNVHKSNQRSHTLMRHAVKKPLAHKLPKHSIGLTDVTPAQQPASHAIRLQADKAREARASKIKRSSLVSRFSDVGTPAASLLSASFTPTDQPVASRMATLSVQPAPAHSHPMPGQIKRQLPKSVPSKVESVIAQGLRTAQSHQQPAHKLPRKARRGKRTRLAGVGAASLAVLLLGGFFAYQNIPQLSMRYAATRAGVQAQLPGYNPSGFSLDKRIQYNPGQITLRFQSNTDDRAFTITQRTSTWNSQALRDNYIASASDQVQTYEDKGRTIYLYGDSNATWVNGGIWYDIHGNSQLNSDQLVRIATSM